MKNTHNPTLTPKLRFPEFRKAEGWKPKTLAEICLQISNGKANAQDHEEDGNYPLFDRSATIKESSEFMFDAEAVILPGEGMRFIPKYFQGKFNLHQRAYALMRHQGDGRFVYYSLDYLQDALAKKAVKSTVLSLRLPIVQDFVIGCPACAEQRKIASCLSSLDELIAAQSQKLTALKLHKKGLMQNLFPSEGESTPRLRFPEFRNAGEWECEGLSNCLKKVIDYRGKAPPKSESGVPLITAKNVRFGWLDMTNDEYIEEDKYEEWMSRGIPQAGDILFTTEAPLGNVALFPCAGKFALGQRLLTLRSKSERCLPEFLFHSLLCPTMQEEIDFHSTGSTAKGIKSAVFVNLSFCHPKDIDEQQRIADCLTTLDDLIAAQTKKLEALKVHKKGLMQNLFPSSAEVEQ